MLQDLNTSEISGSTLERAARRRDAFGLAILVALGLTLNDDGNHLVDGETQGSEHTGCER